MRDTHDPGETIVRAQMLKGRSAPSGCTIQFVRHNLPRPSRADLIWRSPERGRCVGKRQTQVVRNVLVDNRPSRRQRGRRNYSRLRSVGLTWRSSGHNNDRARPCTCLVVVPGTAPPAVHAEAAEVAATSLPCSSPVSNGSEAAASRLSSGDDGCRGDCGRQHPGPSRGVRCRH